MSIAVAIRCLALVSSLCRLAGGSGELGGVGGFGGAGGSGGSGGSGGFGGTGSPSNEKSGSHIASARSSRAEAPSALDN
jgi:hypothetical protein